MNNLALPHNDSSQMDGQRIIKFWLDKFGSHATTCRGQLSEASDWNNDWNQDWEQNWNQENNPWNQDWDQDWSQN